MFYRKYRRLPAEADSAYAGEKRVENREVINDVLVHLFNEIMELEEQAIITEEYKDITNNDMHIIEAVGPAQWQLVLAETKCLTLLPS